MAADISAAVEGLAIKRYNISVSGENCSVSQSLPADSNYYLATIRAPKTNSAGDYFTYWLDNEGNIVGTYRNYSFYAVKDASFTPVFSPRADYEEARKVAVIASRALESKTNRDGTVLLYGEHSVSSTEESINGHGLLATTDSSLATDANLVIGSSNENVHNFMARSSSANLTGLVEVQAALTGSTVWARTYVVDKNGEVKYGDIESFAISVDSHSADEDVIIVDSESLDLTAQNEGGDSPAVVDEPAAEKADTFTVIIDMLKNILASVINYVKLALSILK
ncbi:MAG: hypothetical protein IJU45_05970 [Clostridia bacterium]|nr:hypothetical protein [Clostridia bacterium]